MAHARLSASAAHRWMVCPGSVSASAAFPNTSSPEAAQGTYAHTLAAGALVSKATGICEFLGDVSIVDGHEVVCDGEMVEGVQEYVDFCRSLIAPADLVFVEMELTEALRDMDPDLGGTADFVRYRPVDNHLHVVDLKYGAGVWVEVVGNKQLAMYALGALLTLHREGHRPHTVTVSIVQPRIPGETCRSWTLTFLELLDFVADIQEAAGATREAMLLVASPDGCKWCPARAMCPELEKQQTALVAESFSHVEPYDPATLAAALDAVPMVEARIKAIREFAYAEAIAGRVPPGHKLVEKRAVRKYEDPAGIAATAPSDWFEPAPLKSPAQLEKHLGKKKYKDFVAPHVISISSGLTLVVDTDKRAAAVHAGAASASEFGAVIEGTATEVTVESLFSNI